AVVSVSHAVAASLSHKSPAYLIKSRVIRNALPVAVEREIDHLREKRQPSRHPALIVALGRLTAQKNYPQLIDAMAAVEGSRLQIIGGGEDEAALRAHAELACPAGRVEFCGHLPRDRALKIAAASDIFVQ